ncbi:arginine--tRNA ligase [Campylobacter sp. faydin G-105]|uniref:arginine--tRNA ligase n=1 Tax=Campylobacter anatolicus TaxID=2829105 RepID=UPI001B8E587F|nr:arginine--tRNA ligase [Campylobacter anatolicus]MBR8461675.1 arginine--tRNA ligase [Campylobacter anatolicus]
MKEIVKAEIYKVLEREFVLEKPKDRSLAHYATPMFSLAKELKKSPVIIAQEFADKFIQSEIFEASAVNGYLNFKLKPKFLDEISHQALQDGAKFATGSSKEDESLFIEYISANPTGPLHIGHVRGAVFGDTLARIGRHLGYEIFTEYYINDAGNQIDLLGTSIALAARNELFGESVEYPEKYYRGEYIIKIAKLALEKFGKEIFYNNERNLELAEFGKDIVLDIIKKDLADVGIHIQSWASEKALYGKLDATIQKLKRSNQMYEKDGAIYIASTTRSDDNDRVVVRDDGRPTYLAGDIVYHNDKFERGYDRYVNIWGADHHGYIARLKAAINFLGYDENRLEIILMQMVSLLKDGKPYKMSKRAGNAVLMSDIAEEIGADALRFIFISKANTSSLEFDIDELKKEDSSNPIYYINYAHARINQIFGKANKSVNDVMNASFDSLDENGKNLLFEALVLPEVLQDAYSSRQLQKLPDYLKSLAASFHKFYNENRVVGSENEDSLLKLFAVVALSIRTALSLIGINAKDRM